EPAFPMATTQINAATPTAIPRMVRALRSQLRVRATNASRDRALKFMRKRAEVDFTANPHGGKVYIPNQRGMIGPAASRVVSYGRNEYIAARQKPFAPRLWGRVACAVPPGRLRARGWIFSGTVPAAGLHCRWRIEGA